MSRIRITILTIGVLLSLAARLSASGLFPKGEEDIRLDEINAVYAVNSQEGTITAVIRQRYYGDADNFLWLFPIPDSHPEVRFQATLTLPEVQTILETPDMICARIWQHNGGDPAPDDYPPWGYPQAQEYQVLSGETVAGWSQEHGYRLSDSTKAVINRYIQQDMWFVAVEMSQQPEGTRGDTPVEIRYRADQVMLPVRFEDGRITVHLTILGDTRYVPVNYGQAEIDYSLLRSDSILGSTANPISAYAAPMYFTQRSNYQTLRDKTLFEHNYLTFITEYAGNTADIITRIENQSSTVTGIVINDDRDQAIETLRQYRYLTQLYGIIPGGSNVDDPVFVSDPDEADISNVIDLKDEVDPLEYWGCSTRSLPTIAELPSADSFLYTTEYGRRLAYPSDWVRSSFEINGTEFQVFASTNIDEEVFMDYINGKLVPPMLVLRRGGFYDRLYEGLELPKNIVRPAIEGGLIYPCNSETAIKIALLTSDEDLQSHRAMYEAIFNYPRTFSYYRHPKLMHTLFYKTLCQMEFGFPDGWKERMEGKSLVISPESMGNDPNAPALRLYPAAEVMPPVVWTDYEHREEYVLAIIEHLENSFQVDSHSLYEKMSERDFSLCGGTVPVQFNANGKRGYVRYLPPYMDDDAQILEISAPIELYEQYKQEIEWMSEAVSLACG